MGRGYLFGVLVGAAVAALGLGGVSLMVPVRATDAGGTAADIAAADTAAPEAASPAAEPEVTPGVAAGTAAGTAAETGPEATPEPAPEPVADAAPAAMPEAAPEPAPGTAAGTAPETLPAATPPASAAATPETPVVEVPAGSEFNRPKPETDPVVPAAEPEPAPAALPRVAEPAAETAPALSVASPAAMPATTPAPAAPAAPEPAAPAAVASAPAAEAAVPVPPPGEAAAPSLVTEPAPEVPGPMVAAAPESAPEPEPAPEPAPEATPEAAAMPGADAVPAPDEVVPPAPAPAEVAEPAAPSSGLPAAEDDAPAAPEEEMPEQDGGPIIIGSAPDAPKPGFGQTVQPGFGSRVQPGFGQSTPGVRINRLPRIGETAPATEPGVEPGAEPAIEPATEPDFVPAPGEAPVVEPAPAEPQAENALKRFAAAFDNPDLKPLVAVVLVDIGEAAGGVAPDAIAAIGRPVTVAIDPAAADAGARATVYRLGGDEVAILAPDLPAGATPSDLEIGYQGMVSAIPEAVAVVGRPASTFQTDRRIAQHLVSLLATGGRGLVTYTRGLDPARQAAEREGLPHAAVFRDLDAEGETPATILHSLDRAAFEAARSGDVVVIGTTSAETVAALREWIAGGAKGAAVGPVSAAMSGG